jgi:hypothetical protein
MNLVKRLTDSWPGQLCQYQRHVHQQANIPAGSMPALWLYRKGACLRFTWSLGMREALLCKWNGPEKMRSIESGGLFTARHGLRCDVFSS